MWGLFSMSECQEAEVASAAAKARIVRAFYDAADKLMEERINDGQAGEVTSLALQRLTKVVVEGAAMDEPEFTRALQFAADVYFSHGSSSEPKED